MQYYHRRMCWLALREFRRAALDADHTLAFMDFVRDHSPDEEWTLSHEQYRPFVLFHRVQAATLARLEEAGPADAIEELKAGVQRFHELFSEFDAEEQFEDDELVQRLIRAARHAAQSVSLETQLVGTVGKRRRGRAIRAGGETARRTFAPPWQIRLRAWGQNVRGEGDSPRRSAPRL